MVRTRIRTKDKASSVHDSSVLKTPMKNASPVKIKKGAIKSKKKEDAVAIAQAQDLEEINELLFDNPAKIHPCLAACRGGEFLKRGGMSKQQIETPAERWPENLEHFSSVPKAWLWQNIQDLEPEFTDEWMAKMEVKNRKIGRWLGTMAFSLDERDEMPLECADPVICSRVLDKRYALNNSPLHGFTKQAGIDLEDGTLDFATCMLYKCVFEKRSPYNLSSIVHAGGFTAHQYCTREVDFVVLFFMHIHI